MSTTAGQQNGTTQTIDAPESKRILTARNAAMVLIDHQPQTIFGIQSHDRGAIINAAGALAETAKVFKLPVVLTTVAAADFTGPIIPEIQRVFPDIEPIDRSGLNSWADPRLVAAIEATGRKKLIMAGTWTDICLVLPVISALDAGYEVYIVPDASGAMSKEAHDMGIQRMVQAGAVPVSWVSVISELQYDWARQDTYDAVSDIFMERAGALGAGINYFHALRSTPPKIQAAA